MAFMLNMKDPWILKYWNIFDKNIEIFLTKKMELQIEYSREGLDHVFRNTGSAKEF